MKTARMLPAQEEEVETALTLEDELHSICADLQIHDWQGFSFRGQYQSVPTPGADQGGRERALQDALRDCFYTRCYIRQCDGDGSQNLLPMLQRANQSPDYWDAAWSVYQLGTNGTVMVQKGERSRTVIAGEYVSNKIPGMPPQTGDQLSVRVFPGSHLLQDGFYFAFSKTLGDQFDEYELLRFYFNLQASGACELLAAVTRTLNQYLLPFRFKTLQDGAAYRRADAAVLYVAKRHYAQVANLVLQMADRLQPYLRSAIPLFCKELAPGIGVAEDPGSGESFGMHRCRLLAQAVLRAWQGGAQQSTARMQMLRQIFQEQGLQLDKPYLNPRSRDLFEHPIFAGGIQS